MAVSFIASGIVWRWLMNPAPGSRERVPLPHPEVFAALAPGVQLLIDDGKMRLGVEEATQSSAVARVLIGGPLSERKGVSVVGAVLPISAITEKDRRDLSGRHRLFRYGTLGSSFAGLCRAAGPADSPSGAR